MIEPDPDDDKSSEKPSTDYYSVNEGKQNLEFKEAFNCNFIFRPLLNEIAPENPEDDIYFHLPESNQNNNMEHIIILLGNESEHNKIVSENPGDGVCSCLPESNQNNNMEHIISLLGNEKEQNEIVSENPGDGVYSCLPELNQNDKMENMIGLLGRKRKRKDHLQKFKNLNLKDSPYRFDYFIKLFKGYFLLYVKITLNDLVNNCKFGKKFGKINFHSPCRDKYAGNSNEESNSIFIGLTIEQVFTDVGTSYQEKNKEYVNKIRKKFKELESKPNRNEKENEQYEAIKILMDYLGTKIKKALNQYYDSEEFGEFRSDPTIKKYNNKFNKERKRNFYLLDKNNYVRLFKKEKKNN